MALKYSRQREAIKEFLAERKDHPTADTVYMGVRKEFPNISLGTVYRNLNLLADMGEILRISTGDGPNHYDGNIALHYHFICTQCNKVFDIDMEPQIELDKLAAKHFDGIITNHVTHFFGLCPECNKNNQNH